MSDVKAKIKEYILAELAPDGDTELDDDTNLLEEEIVDSLGIFTLVSYIDSTFGITVEPEEVNLDNFETLDTITALVQSKLS